MSIIKVLAEVNGFLLFTNIAQLISYAGLDVIDDESGKLYANTLGGLVVYDVEKLLIEARSLCENNIAGETTKGTEGAVTGRPTKPIYLDVRLQRERTFAESLPSTINAFVLVTEGSISLASTEIEAGNMAILGEGDAVEVSGLGENNRFLLIAGQAIDEPIARGGPFVMNTQDEIKQAFADYQSGNF